MCVMGVHLGGGTVAQNHGSYRVKGLGCTV